MTLMAGHCADVRAAASYAPKEPMPMRTEEAIEAIQAMHDVFTGDGRDALATALDALKRADEDRKHIDRLLSANTLLKGDLADAKASCERIEIEKCNWVRKARDFEYRADRLERIADVLLDRIEHGS